MIGSERDSLIAQLQKAYEDELPSVDGRGKDSFFDTSTSTLVCLGDGTAQRSDISEAVNYFKMAASKLSENPSPENDKKVKYCQIAVNALTDLLNKG